MIIQVNDEIAFGEWYNGKKYDFCGRPLLKKDLITPFAINGIYIDIYDNYLTVSCCGNPLISLGSYLINSALNNETKFNTNQVEILKSKIDKFLLQMSKMKVFA